MVHHLEACVHQDLGWDDGDVLCKVLSRWRQGHLPKPPDSKAKAWRGSCPVHQKIWRCFSRLLWNHEEKELVETCISNMLFDYRLNLENLCITQFDDLLQRTKRTALTMKQREYLYPRLWQLQWEKRGRDLKEKWSRNHLWSRVL